MPLFTIPGAMGYRVDKNLKNPYSDQFSVGLERQLSADFSVDLTYLYKIQRNVIGFTNAAGIYLFGTDPNNLINAKGLLNIDRRWSLKASAVYDFPLGILASANLTYQQGRPRLHFVRVYDLAQRPDSYVSILAEPKGTERFPDELMVDMRLQKSFRVARSFELQIFADIFNLFNSSTFFAYADYNLWSDSYNIPSEMSRPRRVQVGAKIQF